MQAPAMRVTLRKLDGTAEEIMGCLIELGVKRQGLLKSTREKDCRNPNLKKAIADDK